MYDITKLKKKFIKEQMGEEAEKLTIYVDEKPNEINIMKAIEKAYNDSQPRTIEGHSKILDELGDVLKSLRDKLKEYFENFISKELKIKENFDEWHYVTCNSFLNEYNKLLKKHNCEEQTFGKAQKIVNMTFKYLYCYEDAKEDWFSNCHMPLDKYTYEMWFYDYVIKDYNATNKNNKLLKKDMKVWSKLECEEEINEKKKKGSYIWMQERIRIYLSKTYTPLNVEFFIWNKMKEKAECKEFIGSINKMIELGEMSDYKEDLVKIKKRMEQQIECINKKILKLKK